MIADVKKAADQKMQKTVEALKADLGKVRTGRAHTGLLDHIHVDYYGTPTPLNQVANLTLPDARTIAVTPYEKKHGRRSSKRPSAIPTSASIRPLSVTSCACRCRR